MNITSNRIQQVMESFGVDLGKVERVDLVNKGKYNSAYVHFQYWNDNDFVARFQERAADPEKVCKLVYDDPWYWIILQNTSHKRIGPERRKEVIQLPSVPLEVGNTNINKESLSDLWWQMELMQTEIDDLRDVLMYTGILEEEEDGSLSVGGDQFKKYAKKPLIPAPEEWLPAGGPDEELETTA